MPFLSESIISTGRSLVNIKIKYTEDGIPTLTTSLKNVGLNEPERSGAEDIPAIRVILSPRCGLVVSTADSTVPK